MLEALREKIDVEKKSDIPDIPKRGVILLELEDELASELDAKVRLRARCAWKLFNQELDGRCD